MNWILLSVIWMIGPSGPMMTAKTQPGVRTLAVHQSVRISYASNGCEHSLRYEVLISHKTNGLHATIKRLNKTRWNRSPRKPVARLGRFKLNKIHTAGLDSLFRWYRSNPKTARCTTSDVITLSWLKNGNVTSSERFVDETCATGRQPGLLTLLKLVEQLTGKSPW